MRRLGELQDMRARHRGHRGPQGSVTAELADARESGKLVIEAEGITKAYGGRTIVAPFSIRVHRGDCIGPCRAERRGQDHAAQAADGQLAPDSGTIRLGTNLDIVMLDQRRENLDLDATLAHYLTDGRGETLLVNGEQRHVVGYMKEFCSSPNRPARRSATCRAASGRG